MHALKSPARVRAFPRRRVTAAVALVAAWSLFSSCSVDKLVAPPIEGVLVPGRSSLVDSAAVGSSALRFLKVGLRTSRPGNLAWRAERAQNSSWLSLVRIVGNAPDTLEIRLSPASLAVGTYRDTLVLSTNNSEAPPLRLPVEFTIHPCRVTTVPLDTVVSSPLDGNACASPRTAGMFARLFDFTGTAGDSVTIELQATGFNAQLVVDTAAGPTSAPPLAQVTACRGVTGDPCLTYFALPVSGHYYVEVTGATPAAAGTFVLNVAAPAAPAPPATLQQLRDDSVTTIVVGQTISNLTVVLRARVTDPDAVDTLRLEAELRPVSQAFTGAPTHTSGLVANGDPATIVTLASDDSAYHWRVRAADQTGRRGPWVSFGTNAETQPDFIASVAQAPGPPAALAQLRASDLAPIPLGGTSTTRSVTFRATLTDPDPGDSLRLEIEVRPVGTVFSNTFSVQSQAVANANTAQVTISALNDATPYHWQARVVDRTGAASAWVPFGNNAGAADFTVNVPVAHLTFTVQPSGATAGQPITPAVQVRALDSDSNTALSFSGSITIALGANPPGGALSGTVTLPASNGVATFSNLRVDRAGSGYTLRATAPSLPSISATSQTFAVVAGAPTQLAFTVQPSGVAAGAVITPAIEVSALDAAGNPAPTFADTVSLALGSNPGGATLGGTTRRKATNGVATFANVQLNKAGSGYTLAATASGLTGATSAAFNVTASAVSAGQSTVAAAPGTITASSGSSASTITVTARDAQGNPVSGATVVLAAQGAGVAITQPAAVTNAAGVATGTISATAAGTKIVSATINGVAMTQTASVTITAAAPSTAQSTVSATSPITAGGSSSIITVTALDAFGNPVAGRTVTLAATGTGNTLTQPATVTNANGTTTGTLASTVSGNKVVSATITGAGAVTQTDTVVVIHGPATKVVFTRQPPASVTAGTSMAPAPQVSAQDSLGNVATGYTGAVAIAIDSGPAGANLSGTAIVSATAGVAEFPGLSIDRAGGYRLGASATNLTAARSAAFTVVSGGASKLVITQEPSANAQSDVAFTTQPIVALRDAQNNAVASAGIVVTATVASGPGGSSLTNATATTSPAGVATFSGLRISGPVGTYTLRVATGSLTPDTTAAIALAAGPPAALAIQTQPSDTVQNGIAFPQQPVIQIRDAAGNPVSLGGQTVTATIASGGGVLGPVPATATTGASGAAVYTSLTITGTAGPRTLQFTSGALSSALSSPVVVTAGTATQIAVQGGNGQTAIAGTAVTTPPAVIARDVSGNPVADVSVTFTVTGGGGAINPPSPAALLTGPNGIAQLTGWTLGAQAGTNELQAQSGTLAGSPITFVATASAGQPHTIAKFSGDNLTGQVGAQLTTPHDVRITDINGNPVPNVIVTWSAPGGGSVTPAIDTTDLNGHAQTFRTLGITPGTYSTTASATLSGGVSTVTFTSTAQVSGATQMQVAGGNLQKDTVGQQLPLPLAVRVADAFNNPVQGVQVSWSVIDGNGSFDSVTSTSDAQGIARTHWTVGTQTTTTDSTQVAQATGVGSPVFFTAFTVPDAVSPTATTLTVAPGTITASTGSSASTITLTARDQYGNLLPGKAVTLGATGTGNALTQPAGPTNASGVATGSLSSTAAGAKVVSAQVAGVAIAQQRTVTAVPGNATRLAFFTQPSNAAAGSAIAPAVQVEVQDDLGNRVTTASNGITLGIAGNPAGVNLTGAGPISAVSGLATFSNLTLDKTGTYTLTAINGVLAPDTSVTFTIVSGVPSAIVIVAGSGQSATVGTPVAAAPAVAVRDQFGNAVAGQTVTFAVTAGGGTTNPASPADVISDANGVASLTSWTLGTTAGTNSLQAVSGSLGPATFTATGTPAQATQIAIHAGDGQSATVGTAVATPPAARVRDQHGNPVPGVNVTFSVTGGGGAISSPTTIATDATGIASLTSWTLGTAAGANTVQASAGGLTGSPLTFTATGAPAGVSPLTTTVAASPSTIAASTGASTSTITVTARDQYGNAVSGATVALAAAGSNNLLGQPGLTDAAGVATGTLSSITAELKTVSATVNSVAINQTATVTVTAAQASSITVNAGNGQSATVGTAVAVPPAVVVRDAFNNPVAGVGVTFTITVGSGTTDPVSGTTVGTGATGVAALTSWTLGTTAGSNTLEAAAAGLAGSPVTFSATGTAASAATMAIQAGDGQTATVATAVAVPPAVIVRDGFGNPVSGVSVTFTVTPGGGSTTPASPTAIATDPSGVAALSSWTLGTTAGTNQLQASTTGLSGNPLTFTATATPGSVSASRSSVSASVSTIQASAGSITAPITVTARDQFDNPIAGAIVILASSGAGNALTQPSATDIAGMASGALSATVAEMKIVSATIAGVGILQTDTVTVTPAAISASRSGVSATPSTIAASNGSVTSAITVTARDAFDNPIGGAVVALATSGSANALVQPPVTNAAGAATGSLSSTLAEAKTVSATLNGLAVTQTATVTVVPAAATSAALHDGNGQSATVGTAVATAPAVIVHDAFGNPVSGVDVVFTVTAGGGALVPAAPATIPTNSGGIAALTTWTLGTAPGSNAVAAAAAGLTGSPVTFTATATTGAASTITAFAGNGQTATVGTSVAAAPAVLVRDQFDNPVSGVAVTFTLTAGAGSTSPVSPASIATDASGVAALTSWTLGTTAGPNALQAAAGGLNGSPVTFTATGAPGPVSGAQSTVSASPGSIVASNGSVTSTITVTARDEYGNVISSAPVALAASGSGNAVTQPGLTDAAGVTAGAVSSSIAESKTISATVSGVPIAQTAVVTVTAAAVSGAQSTIVAAPPTIAASSGGSTITFTVTARDAFGNPVTGASVVLAASGTGNALTQPAAVTDGAGVASGTLSSTVAETKTVSATVSGVTVTQTAAITVTPAAAAAIAVNAGDGQSAAVGTAVAIPPSVVVRDAFGNPVGGTDVVFTVKGGSGTTQPASPATVTSSVTGSAALTSWTLGSTAGANTLEAASGSLSGSPLTFTATGTAGAVSGAQSTLTATPDTIFASSGAATSTITVTARDAFGNPVSGATVVLAASGASNTLTQPGAATNALGQATGTLSSTLAGARTVSATINGVSVSQTVVVTIKAGGASPSLSLVSATPGSIVASNGSSVSTITVTARDAFSNPIVGATVVLSATGSGNTITQPALTNASGVATGTLSSTVAQATTVSAAIDGVAVTQTAAVTVTAAAAATIGVNAGDGQSATVNTALAVAPSAVVRDAFGNPVSGVAVAFTVLTGGGSISPSSPQITTSAGGVATLNRWTLGTTAGTNTLQAAASGLGGSPVVFTATGLAGPASQMTVQAGNGQSAPAGTAVATAPAVLVRDQFNNPVAGHNVVFTVTGGGGSLVPASPATIATSSAGVAALTSWTLGTTVGANALQATSSGLTPLNFAATATAGPVSAATSTVVAAPGTIIASSGSSAATITVTARDQFNNPISGATVVLSTTGTANTLTQPAGTTGINGEATGTFSSTTAEDKTVTASINGVAVTLQAVVTVTPAAASQLVFTQEPTSALANTPISPAIVVTIRDAFGNTVTGFVGTVTMAIEHDPSVLPPAQLTGTNPVNVVNGAAIFSDLAIDKTGIGYTLRAFTGLLSVVSTAFTIL